MQGRLGLINPLKPSGHYMYHTVVTVCTTSLTFNNSTFCPHTVFMCFVWISEQTAIISLYNIKQTGLYNREMIQTKVVQKIKTHILCSVTVLRKSCRLRDNVEKYSKASRSQMAIWRMRIPCWTPKATNTHSQYVTLILFPLQQ
jgi:hypothetical protein